VLAEEGIKYTLDMVHDDQPMPVKVRNGRLISVPYSLEVNDVPLFQNRNTPVERYTAMVKAQFDQLYAEGAESGTVMCLPLHPYLTGQPQRIAPSTRRSPISWRMTASGWRRDARSPPGTPSITTTSSRNGWRPARREAGDERSRHPQLSRLSLAPARPRP
jgi:hypothetical protein